MQRAILGLIMLPLMTGTALAGEEADNSSPMLNIERTLNNPASDLEIETALELQQMYSEREEATSDAINSARSVCYSALTGNSNRSLIMVPLTSNTADLDALCHVTINNGWHAGGVAKSNYFTQNCNNLANTSYGGGYTSYVTESYFEGNRSNYSNCNSDNAFVCCSPQFPN